MLNLLLGSLSYNEFFSIFFVTIIDLPRPIRYTVYYVKLVYMMSITALFY